MWQDYINIAIQEMNPQAMPGIHYTWITKITDSENSEPMMDYWNEEVLGVLDWVALQESCERIKARANVPLKVTAAQARQALSQAGLLNQVKATIEAYNDEQISIWFDHALEWYRQSPYVLGMGLELGLTEQQVDNLFILANQFQ